MAELTNAVSDLLKGKNIDDNLRIYADGLSGLYNRLAYIKLSMNYFTFSEIYSEMDKEGKGKIEKLVDRTQAVIKRVILEDGVSKEAEEEIISIRKKLISYMETLTSYVDRFQICEYMLNRVEYRFKAPDFNKDYYNEKFEKDIFRYITNDKDNSVINMKITQVVSELPMRLSKNKFYDLIKDSYSLYKGSEKGSVMDFTYMIRTAGVIYIPRDTDNLFENLEKCYHEFMETDFSTINEDAYKIFREHLDVVTSYVSDWSDGFVMLMEVINDLLSIILSEKNLYDVNEQDILKKIINESYLVINGDKNHDDDTVALFENFEGIQEKMSTMIFSPESSMDEIIDINKNVIEKSDSFDKIKKLEIIKKLQSGSTFASIDNDPENMVIAEEDYIMETVKNITEEFSKLFEISNRLFRRAVMASVIGNLPVFFNNLEEFKEYVHIALSQCNDDAEKQACMSLINMLIRNE